jgi:tellurite methyltransferase
MERTIVGFHQDEAGAWVAELSCLHGQHIRHQPPFRLAPWVLDEAERASRVGAPIECPLCDRAELPGGLEVVRSTRIFDEGSMPAGLRRAHRVAAGLWGRLHVEEGTLRFRAATQPPMEVELGPGGIQPIPPETDHDVEPEGPVRFFVQFLGRSRASGG